MRVVSGREVMWRELGAGSWMLIAAHAVGESWMALASTRKSVMFPCRSKHLTRPVILAGQVVRVI